MIPRAAPLLEVKELSSLQGYRGQSPLAVWQSHRDEVAQWTHKKQP